MTELCEVVITAPDPDWLYSFARTLVEDRLAASAHNFTPIRSIYRWQGQVYERAEGRVSLHTRRERVAEIVARAQRDHPYEVPGVSTRPIIDGNPDYLAWIAKETDTADMGVGNSAEAIAGPVDESWLDDVTPWLATDSPSAITLLPDRIAGGKAVYSADTAPLVKQIRSQGFDVQFLSTPDQTFKSEYGAESVIFLAFLLNIASSAAWDSFKFLLHMIRLRVQGLRQAGVEPQLTLSQGIFRYPDGSSYFWQRFSGSAEQVLHLAESAMREYMSVNEGLGPSQLDQESDRPQPPDTAPE